MAHSPEDNSDPAGAAHLPLFPAVGATESGYASMENIADLRRRSARTQRLLAHYANQVFGLYDMHQRVTHVLDARGEPMIDSRFDVEISTREYVNVIYAPVPYDPVPGDGDERRFIEVSEMKVYEKGKVRLLVPEVGIYTHEDEFDGDPSVVFSCHDLAAFSGGAGVIETHEPSIPEILYDAQLSTQAAELQKRDAELAGHILWLGRAASILNVSTQHMEPFAVDPFWALNDAGMN
ncbi:MAG TPA: hypothetical protein VLG11_04435 [Candidatus Saccharimonadales bacterium]|nr:hypothetical protein [Candidatus Saccharimonadales bacterium]